MIRSHFFYCSDEPMTRSNFRDLGQKVDVGGYLLGKPHENAAEEFFRLWLIDPPTDNFCELTIYVADEPGEKFWRCCASAETQWDWFIDVGDIHSIEPEKVSDGSA